MARQLMWYDEGTGACGRMDAPCIPSHSTETVATAVPAAPPATPPNPPANAEDESEHYVCYDDAVCIYHLEAGTWTLLKCIPTDLCAMMAGLTDSGAYQCTEA